MDNFRFNAPKTVINRFDDAAEVDFWTPTWGTAPSLALDPQDAGGGSATSDSLKVSADYFTPEANGWEQMVITRNFDPVVGGLTHTAITEDGDKGAVDDGVVANDDLGDFLPESRIALPELLNLCIVIHGVEKVVATAGTI
jgi:hypothetical protein